MLTLPLFVTNDKRQVTQVVISSSQESVSSLLKPSSLSSSEADGDGEEEAVKPPMTACRHEIRPT